MMAPGKWRLALAVLLAGIPGIVALALSDRASRPGAATPQAASQGSSVSVAGASVWAHAPRAGSASTKLPRVFRAHVSTWAPVGAGMPTPAEVEAKTPLTPHGTPRMSGTAGRIPATRAASAKASAGGGDLIVSTGSPNAVLGSAVAEPTVAVNGSVALMTWNWSAAVTVNGGASFSYLDPFEDEAYGGFCCDQVAYYDPTHDLYIWIVQYRRDAAGNNAIRISVAHGASGLSSGSFKSWDLTPQQIGRQGEGWWDQPKVARSNNFLYLEVTGYAGSTFFGSYVFRVPLNDLAGDGALDYDFFRSPANTPGFAEGSTDTMYFAGHLSTTMLQLYAWPEGVDASGITSSVISHHAYPRSLPYSCRRTNGPANSDWCQRPTEGSPGHYSHDDRIQGGWKSHSVVGFAWDASQGEGGLGSFPFPYVHVVRINATTKTLIDEPILWNAGYAFSYSAIAANAAGDLGGSVMWGGGPNYENCGLLVHDGYTTGAFWELNPRVTSSADPSEAVSGDYLAARADPANPARWAATCYSLNPTMQPSFFSFGRQAPAVPVSVSKAGSGDGSIASSPAGVTCGDLCVASFVPGSTVTLTATPSANAEFRGWTGDCTGTGACTLTMDGAHSVQATFVKLATLSLTKIGSGSGEIRSNPPGIECGSMCSARFADGTSVTLTASPTGRSDFLGWGGDCSGTQTCTLSMTTDHSVTARFGAICIVPRVVGKTVSAAGRVVRAAGCRIGAVTRKYSRVRKGRVIAQAPRNGVRVPGGSAVALKVSRGPKPHRRGR